MYLAIISCTDNWIVIKWNMNSLVWLCSLFQVLDGLSDQWTGYHSYLQAVFGKERLWSCGWGGGVFREQPTHNSPSVCLVFPEWGGGDACRADMSVSAAHFQITLSVCVNMGRSVWTWLAAEWQGLVLKAGMLVRCSTIPQKPCGTNLLKCVRINMMLVP